jgi:hypothetical protein
MSSDLSLGPSHRAGAPSGIARIRWIRGPAWDLVWVRCRAWFATSFIHYVLDRAAFRFSSPEVRQAARGLLQ